jgi:hypothetical protein
MPPERVTCLTCNGYLKVPRTEKRKVPIISEADFPSSSKVSGACFDMSKIVPARPARCSSKSDALSFQREYNNHMEMQCSAMLTIPCQMPLHPQLHTCLKVAHSGSHVPP